MSQADIGLVGLAVMGENLILNMESKGFTVAAFNRLMPTGAIKIFLRMSAPTKIPPRPMAAACWRALLAGSHMVASWTSRAAQRTGCLTTPRTVPASPCLTNRTGC